MLLRGSIYLSAMNSPTEMESGRWRRDTLSLLNKRLTSPMEAVNDATVISVLLLTHESVRSFFLHHPGSSHSVDYQW
jgi:hypothetical protein